MSSPSQLNLTGWQKPRRAAVDRVHSESITLEPGDVIATGTPAGVGFARKPPVFLRPGDKMEVVIETVGGMDNPVIGADDLYTQTGRTDYAQTVALVDVALARGRGAELHQG